MTKMILVKKKIEKNLPMTSPREAFSPVPVPDPHTHSLTHLLLHKHPHLHLLHPCLFFPDNVVEVLIAKKI
jgi:hypothetical protein